MANQSVSLTDYENVRLSKPAIFSKMAFVLCTEKANEIVQLINNLNYDKLTQIEDLIRTHVQTNPPS